MQINRADMVALRDALNAALGETTTETLTIPVTPVMRAKIAEFKSGVDQRDAAIWLLGYVDYLIEQAEKGAGAADGGAVAFARELGVSSDAIHRVLRGRTWRHVQ